MINTASTLSNEKELFIQMSQGDQVAFTEIFDYYEPRIYPFVLKLTRSETTAEEVVQELFIKIWTSRRDLAKIENHRSYIFRMASNRTANYLRNIANNIRLVQNAAGQVVVEKNTTEEVIDYKYTQQIINKVVDQLPSQQKAVYNLSRQQGLNSSEISKQMGIAEKTVKKHLTEALKFIRTQLQQSPGSAIALILFMVKNAR